ncbi:MAG: integrase [Deltaproteobacteria bacterium]|nr:MAG: integrase [Deltaproteobacteria bacterium]
MLDVHFVNPSAAQKLRTTLLGPWLDSFDDHLSNLGYPLGSRITYVRLTADLGRWMADQELPVEELNESAIDEYVDQRKTQRDRRRAPALHLLAHLRSEGVVPPHRVVPDRSHIAPHCSCYAKYMRQVRGAAEGTVEGYVSVVRCFLAGRFGTGPVDLAVITATDINGFLVQRAGKLSPRRVDYLATALRSFLRFLFVRKETPTDLSTAAPGSLTRHLASVPRYISPAEIEGLLDTCDSTTAGGMRNLAILVLLARLGLRASEVAKLEFDDIRWRSGEIVIRGKGDVVDRLPLLYEVGEALAKYLLNGRPKCSSPRLFLRLCAPIRELGGREAVSGVVRTAIKRAGLNPPVQGAHLLRHSLGTQMIRAGASISEIGEVLRHHSHRSTEIYAKVDFEALRTIAQPWPVAGESR